MSFLLLLRAEWRKLRASSSFQLVAVVIVVIAIGWPTWCASIFKLSDNNFCASDALPWPDSALGALSLISGLSIPLAAFLFSWIVGAEFGRDTWKMSLPRRARRAPFVLAKLLVAGGAFAALTLGVTLAWSGVSAALAPMVGLSARSQDAAVAPRDLLSELDALDDLSAGGSPLVAYRAEAHAGGIRFSAAPLPAPAEAAPTIALGAGLSARIPLSVRADSAGTLPLDSAPPAPRRAFSAEDRTTRLAAVVQAWAAVQAFHPWASAQLDDPDAALAEALDVAATTPGVSGALRRLLAPLRDGHAVALHPADVAERALPWLWEPVEGDLVITWVSPTGGGAARGDRVVRLNGIPIEDAWAEAMRSTSGGTEAERRRRAVLGSGFLRGPGGQAVSVELESPSGDVRTLQVTYALPPGSPREPGAEPLSRLAPDTWYVDLSRITDRDWQSALPKLEQAEKIVFDLREYPGQISRGFLQHLAETPLTSDTFAVPIWGAPGAPVAWRETQWRLAPRAPHIAARVVFITDSRAVSYAESLLSVVARHDLGPIVGGQTSGANGNQSELRLVGDARMFFTGMEVLGPDGESRNRIGIPPTHSVSRTRAGVVEGRDELLEFALDLLEE